MSVCARHVRAPEGIVVAPSCIGRKSTCVTKAKSFGRTCVTKAKSLGRPRLTAGTRKTSHRHTVDTPQRSERYTSVVIQLPTWSYSPTPPSPRHPTIFRQYCSLQKRRACLVVMSCLWAKPAFSSWVGTGSSQCWSSHVLFRHTKRARFAAGCGKITTIACRVTTSRFCKQSRAIQDPILLRNAEATLFGLIATSDKACEKTNACSQGQVQSKTQKERTGATPRMPANCRYNTGPIRAITVVASPPPRKKESPQSPTTSAFQTLTPAVAITSNAYPPTPQPLRSRFTYVVGGGGGRGCPK